MNNKLSIVTDNAGTVKNGEELFADFASYIGDGASSIITGNPLGLARCFGRLFLIKEDGKYKIWHDEDHRKVMAYLMNKGSWKSVLKVGRDIIFEKVCERIGEKLVMRGVHDEMATMMIMVAVRLNDGDRTAQAVERFQSQKPVVQENKRLR